MRRRIENAVKRFAHGFGRLRALSSGVGLRDVTGVPCFIRGGGKPEFLVCGRTATEMAPRLEKAARVHDASFFPAGDETRLEGWKQRGDRQRYTEFLMQLPLARFRNSRGKWRVQRARTDRHRHRDAPLLRCAASDETRPAEYRAGPTAGPEFSESHPLPRRTTPIPSHRARRAWSYRTWRTPGHAMTGSRM